MAAVSATTVKGKITKITSFGAFVSVEGGGSGMIHISEVSSDYVKDIKDYLTEGQEVEALVISTDDSGRMNLSLRRLARKNDFSTPPPEINMSPKRENDSFENMMHRFKAISDDKLVDLKRGYESKRGSGKRRR